MNLQQHNISDNNFEQCIKCTVCTVYCPVAAVNPDYPGPKQAGPDRERLRLKKFGFYDETLKYCINCKRCEVACPSNVKIGDIIQAARIKFSKKKPGVRDFILANTDLVGTLSTPVAPDTPTIILISEPIFFPFIHHFFLQFFRISAEGRLHRSCLLWPAVERRQTVIDHPCGDGIRLLLST